MMADYLGADNITDVLPFLTDKFDQQKEMKELDETTLYLDINLDISTSPSAIAKTTLVGNLPGLIEIPKQYYFNSTDQVEFNSNSKVRTSVKLNEDDLLERIKKGKKGKTVAIGKAVVQKNLREKFDEIHPEMPIDKLLTYVSENPDLGNRDEGDMEEIALLMVNYKVKVGQTKDQIRQRYKEISNNIIEVS
jgi:hypothetical protein